MIPDHIRFIPSVLPQALVTLPRTRASPSAVRRLRSQRCLRSILPRCAYWLTVPTATSYRSSCHVRSGWRRRVWYIDYRHCRHGWGQPSLYLHVGEAFCAGTTGGVGRQTRTWPPARAAPASLDGAARRVRMTCLSLEGGAQLRVTKAVSSFPAVP